MNPLVSVVVPVYNREHLIRETLRSIALQQYRPLEVIVVDDGSSDATASVVRATLLELSLQGELYQISNRGPAQARDYGLQRARGEFLAPIDSDDLWEPEFLVKMVALLETAPSADLAFADFYLCDAKGLPLGRKSERLRYLKQQAWKESGERVWETGTDLFSYLLQEQPVFLGALVMRRSLYHEVGPMALLMQRPRAQSVEWEFFLRCARKTPFLYYEVPMTRIRCHDGNISSTGQLAATVAILEAINVAYALSTEEAELVRAQLAHRCWVVGLEMLENGKRRDSRLWFLKSYVYSGGRTARWHYLLSWLPQRWLREVRRTWRTA